jgi:hypothetical protein
MPQTKYPSSPKEPINISQFLGNYCKSVANGTHLFKSMKQAKSIVNEICN